VSDKFEMQAPNPAWLDRMETEHDNLRAVLAWSQRDKGNAELGLRLAGALAVFLNTRGYWSEERDWLEGVLTQAGAANYPQAQAHVVRELADLLGGMGDFAPAETHMAHSLKLFQELGDLPWSAWVLNRLGWLAREQGDTTIARLRLEESLALYRELGDQTGIAWALVTLGEVAVMQDDVARATTLLEESLTLFRHLANTYGIGWALNHLGHVAQLEGVYERATRLHKESLTLFLEYGAKDFGCAETLQSLGETALADGGTALATTHFTEALALFKDLGHRAGVSWCLAGLAGVAAVNEEPERAAWLWGAAEALRQSIGARSAPAARATRERLQAEVRKQLGEAAFNAKWAEGQSASVEQAVAETIE